MKKTKKGDVLLHLAVKNTDNEFVASSEGAVAKERKKKLVFSPDGELLAVEEGDNTDGLVVVDQIYKDGFFCLN